MSNAPRKFQGVWIPAERWLDRTLSPVEKVMLGEIDSLDTGPRGCYATNAHFADFFDLSISRVSEIISGLAARGLITVDLIREGKRIVERRIRLVAPFENPNTPSENSANPFGKDGEPPSENTQGNNTKNNNTLSSTPVPFANFWNLYPRKVDKAKAQKVWDKLKVTAELFTVIACAIARQSQSLDWLKSNGQFIPHPTTWLHGKRWEDELQAPVHSPSRHTGFNQIDYEEGLVLGADGQYRIAGNL
jgi:hypothetical protein